MALQTEDIVVDYDAGWLAIVLTGTVIHISEVRGAEVLYRFGINSDSNGTYLNIGESISTSETVYIKTASSRNSSATVTITKD